MEHLQKDALPLPYNVPPELRPEQSNGVFPRLTPDVMNRMFEEGWVAAGIVAVIVNPDNQALVLQHAASEKVVEGMQGFLTETLKGTFKDGKVTEVEQIPNAIGRALVEELGFTPNAIPTLDFTTSSSGAWQLMPWDIQEKKALGFVLVLRADKNTTQTIHDRLQHIQDNGGTDEIQGGDFLKWQAIGRNASGVRDDRYWRQVVSIMRTAATMERNAENGLIATKLPSPNLDEFSDDMKYKKVPEPV